MALCNSCSAPLPADSCRCSYCGTRNDMNFAVVQQFIFDRSPSDRQCPDCGIALETCRMDTGGGIFAIERCKQCYGLFFDVGEVPAFLEASVSPAFKINLQEIVNINAERTNLGAAISYKKCPECGVLMNRTRYAAMSGVVVDQCKQHGMWLDNGELVHLMEWKKAGGQLLAERKEQLERHEREQQMEQEKAYQVPTYPTVTYPAENAAVDVVSTVCTVILDVLLRGD